MFCFCEKSQNVFFNMFLYTENDTESHRNTKNINIYPKIHKKHEKTFQLFEHFQTFRKKRKKNLFSKIVNKKSAFYDDVYSIIYIC